MKVPAILFKSSNALPQNTQRAKKQGTTGAEPVYATLEVPDKNQMDTINKALDELSKVEFLPNDLLYVKTMGANPPFQSGAEAIKWIKDSKAVILYANFSNPKVHACLNFDENRGFTILINSNYKNECSKPDILAISEAIFHECGHGKDADNENSIQEELNCLSLNVLAHRCYKKKYPHIFDNENSFLYSEGVSLYPKLFFEFQNTALKNRVAEKYGYLQSGDSKHPATKLADDIKIIYESGKNA